MGCQSFIYLSAGTPPAAFGKSSPVNGNSHKPVILQWGSGASAADYQVCYGKTATCTTWQDVTTFTTKELDGLDANTTYYWQVKAINDFGTTYTDGAYPAFWSFTTGAAPGAFGKIAPANGATGQPYSLTLSWGASGGATRYEVCCGQSNPCTNWVSVDTATSKTLSGLLARSTYYWQVRAVNAAGTTYANDSTFWRFTTGR